MDSAAPGTKGKPLRCYPPPATALFQAPAAESPVALPPVRQTRSAAMPADHHIWNFEIAERLHHDAACASEPRKRRLLDLARIYSIEADMVRGSRHAIAESREVIARANKLLGR